MAVNEFIFNRLCMEAYNGLKSYLKKKNIKLVREEKIVRETILDHINYVNNWSEEVNFKDLNKAKSVRHIYVNLEYYLDITRNNLERQKKNKIRLKGVLENNNDHIIILGQPGAGKTTTMKFICQSLFHNPEFHPEYHFPVLIRLRDLSEDDFSESDDLLFGRIFTTLGLKIEANDMLTHDYSYSNIKECVIKILDELNVIIILDGFDEINPPKKKKKVVKEFEELCLNLNQSRIILTSRLGDYDYSIGNTITYEISSLTDDQILQFAKKWLVDVEKYEDLYSQIRMSPFYDTAIRPLTMAHLCAIYDRFGTIPDKPKNIYKKVVNLLIEEWDSQRMIQRKSSFKNFTTDRKYEFLATFAYKLSIEIQKSIFTKNEISRVFKMISMDYELDFKDEKNVLTELEGQTGLLLQSGYDSFEFAHKSLQEYLTAEYLVKLPMTPTDKKTLTLLPNELAIATCISTDPAIYFSGLVINGFGNLDITQSRIFLTRLILEKPDFKTEPLLGAALLYLRKVDRGENDDLIEKLLGLSKGLRNSISELTNYYVYGMPFQQEEMELSLNKAMINPYSINAPITVTINRSFLKKIGIGKWP